LEPVRKIPIQSRSVAGKFLSYKNNRHISYESQLELAFIYHLEFSPDVQSYVEQPIKVYYKNKKNKSYYVPDFIVYYKDYRQKPLIAEIKYSKEIQERKEFINKKVAILKKYAEENNLDFRLITERELISNKLENYKFLYRYIPEPLYILEFYSIRHLIIEFMRGKIKTTPKETFSNGIRKIPASKLKPFAPYPASFISIIFKLPPIAIHLKILYP
jgi:hypothetical protein